MQFTVRLPAGEHEQYAPGAFDKALHHGQPVTVTLPEGGTRQGRLVAAEIVEDGAAVLLAYEVEGDALFPGWDPTYGLSLGEEP